MSKAQILIICSAASGYRRGGVALDQGDNVFEANQFTEEQLHQLEADPRLKVGGMFEAETDSGVQTQGAVDPDRLAELVKHIEGLDKDNASLWKQDNAGPKASAFPKGTTAEERDAAWDAYVEQQDDAK